MLHLEKYPENPLYGGPATGTLFDVYVTREETQYRMDFSWRPEKALAVAFSKDGLTWSSPQITLSFNENSGWEDDINRNCVLKTEQGYQMWYTGQARGYSYIGYATSEDGIHFHRFSEDPVLICERQWEGMSVMNPCVLYEDGIYKMWYAAGETYEPNVLAYAESPDGIHWEKSKINPIFVKNPDCSYEQDRVGGCQVIHDNKLGYLMFYIGYRDIDTACICVASSPNGRTKWKRYKGNPLVLPDAGRWDGDACYKPSVLYDRKNQIWRIWYNGRRGGEEYIGGAFAHGEFLLEEFI